MPKANARGNFLTLSHLVAIEDRGPSEARLCFEHIQGTSESLCIFLLHSTSYLQYSIFLL